MKQADLASYSPTLSLDSVRLDDRVARFGFELLLTREVDGLPAGRPERFPAVVLVGRGLPPETIRAVVRSNLRNFLRTLIGRTHPGESPRDAMVAASDRAIADRFDALMRPANVRRLAELPDGPPSG